MSISLIVMDPLLRSRRRRRTRRKVLLPPSLRPTMATFWPGEMLMVTFLRIGVAPGLSLGQRSVSRFRYWFLRFYLYDADTFESLTLVRFSQPGGGTLFPPPVFSEDAVDSNVLILAIAPSEVSS